MRSSACGRSGRFSFDRGLFAGRYDPRYRLTNRNVGALGRRDSREDAVGRRFDFDDGFVGFNFEERLPFGDAVTFLLPPGNELAGFLRHLESGHNNAEGHRVNICGVRPALSHSLPAGPESDCSLGHLFRKLFFFAFFAEKGQS
jgi:hypothetical protein